MMKEPKQALKGAADQVGEHVKKAAGGDFANLSQKAMQSNLSVKNLAGVSDQKEEAVYGQAYLLYNTGRYNEAMEIFRVLVTLNSTEPKYLVGLAACFHMLKEYDSAIAMYTLCTFIDPTNPVPHFHLYDCYIQLQDEISAIAALKAAIEKSEGKPEFKTLHERCDISLKGLLKEEKKP